MAVGVFGKLPARRDYVQHGVDQRLMALLDPWLQRAVADSRHALGEAWLDAWLRAPIWRFWLGGRVAGVSVLGAMMPSVDGVGRYFPLCVLGAFEPTVPPPEQDEQAGWFAAVETLMLDALADGGTYEDLLSGLDSLPPPTAAPPPPAPADAAGDVPGAFAALRGAMMAEFYDRFSCWWVPSLDGAAPPRALIRRGLPAPGEYASMIAPDCQPRLAPAMGGG